MSRRLAALFLFVILVAALSGCSAEAAQTTASTPTATRAASTVAPAPTATMVPAPPTPTNVPAGWQVYFGIHFTIAYPADWSMMPTPHQQGLQGGGVSLTSPDNTGFVSVMEEYGYSQSDLQAICNLPGERKMLAGIQMRYELGEGVHRSWSFVNSNGVNFGLDALDATRPQAVQALDDSILTTFRPDDASSGCSH